MWNVPVRFLVMWSPIVAVSIGGGIYIYECTQTLLAPGTGFTVNLPTKSSSLKVTCQNYSIDLIQQTILIDKLVIRKADGSLLARVPHFVATGISVVDGVAPTIQLKDAELWVTRDKKGNLDILDLFEKSESTSSQQPWQVSVRDSVIHLNDLSAGAGSKDEIKIDSGNFVGLGDNAEGNATIDILGLAKGHFGFKKDADKTQIFSKRLTGDLDQVLDRIRSGPEKSYVQAISPLKFDNGTFVGDFTLALSSAKPIFVSNFTLSASNPKWDTYRADRIDFSGTASESGLTGKLKLKDKQVEGDAEGSVDFSKEVVLGANVKVSNLTPSYLQSINVKLPKDVTFNNGFSKGYLTLEKGRLGWTGKSSFTLASVYGLKVPHLDGEVTLQGDQIFAKLKPTVVGGTLIDGNLGFNTKTKEIIGAFSTPQLSAKDFSQWLPTNVLESKARLVGIIGGTIAKPNVTVRGSIEPKFKIADRSFSYNSADVVLRFDGNVFNLDRLTMTDDSGSLFASGSIDLKKGINVRVVGNNVDLAKFADNTSGKVDVQGLITGKVSDLKYDGKVQAYRVGYTGITGKIVAVASDFSGDKKGVTFRELDAMKGASQITGSLGIGFADQSLAGLFAVTGIEVADLYDGDVGGILDLRDIAVSGTFTKPIVAGAFDAKKLLASNFAADSASGKVSFDGELFRIFDTSAVFAKGSVTEVSGVFDAKKKTGNVVGKFQKVDLSDIHQTLRQKANDSGNIEFQKTLSQLATKGSSSGSFEVGVSDGNFASLSGKGRVDDVVLNKATIGSGDWDVGYDGKAWSGNAFIGSLAEYFRVDGLSYSPATGDIAGEFLSYQLPLKELIVAAQPSLNWSQDLVTEMQLVRGRLSTFAKVSGNTKSPTVEVPEFEISSIKLGGDGDGKVEDIGTFSMKANFSNDVLSIQDGLLVGPKFTKITLPFAGNVTLPSNFAIPDGTARLSGTIKNLTDLNYDMTGSVYGFPVSKFATFASSLSDVDVFIDQASFKLTGNIREPLLSSHIKASAGLTPEGKKVKTGLLASRLKIETDISAKPATGEFLGASNVTGKGTFQLNSIAGSLDFSLLTNSSITRFDDAAPFSFNAKIDGQRDVSELIKQAGGIVIGEGGAKLSGGIEVGNTLKAKSYKGGLELRADSIKSVSDVPMIGKSLDTFLKDLVISANFENDPVAGNVLRTKASSATNYSKLDPKASEFGYVRFDAKVPIDDFLNNRHQVGGLMATEIRDGSLAFSNLGMYQSFAQGSFAQGTISTANGKPLQITGDLSKPKISGSIFFDDVKTIIPTLLPTSGTSVRPLIEPEFDLNFFANKPMNIRSSLVSINAKGIGSMKGTLSELKADSVMTVESGELLLPGGKVKLTPDGTITLKYDGSSYNNQAQLIANLHGETTSTGLRNGLTPERYEISLDIKGDLLATEASDLVGNKKDRDGLSTSQGLTITATSQYGPLSQKDIYQLLGRTDILQSLLQSGVNSNTGREVKDLGFGYIVPGLFTGVAQEIMKSFKLDYVGIEYNAFEQASVSFVKNLGAGFFVQGRQQLLEPLPGKLAAYDYRLVYRPRRGLNSIRALSFSFGTDQLRPYKLAIEFNTKIGKRKPPYQTIKLDVPNK